MRKLRIAFHYGIVIALLRQDPASEGRTEGNATHYVFMDPMMRIYSREAFIISVNTLLINYLKNIVEKCDYNVIIRKSAEEYLTLISRDKEPYTKGFRIGFIDFYLPGKNGLEFIQFLFENNHEAIARHLVLLKDDGSSLGEIDNSPYARHIQIMKKPYYPWVVTQIVKENEQRQRLLYCK
ncbi:MAG: hypothetical protein ACMUIP_12395 [bacterium]